MSIRYKVIETPLNSHALEGDVQYVNPICISSRFSVSCGKHLTAYPSLEPFDMPPALIALLLGIAIGALASGAGAFLSYWFGLRAPTARSRAPLGYLFLIVGALGVTGVFAVIGSILRGHSLLYTFLIGVGIMIGFSIAFAILLFAWIQHEPDE